MGNITFSSFIGREGDLFCPDRKDIVGGIIAVMLVSGSIGLRSMGRRFFTFGTETDFFRFVHEAQRFLDGRPFDLKYHPPFYKIGLAMVQLLTGDWFISGLVLSWCGGIIVLITSFFLFYRLYGRFGGWGSLIGLATSSTFLSYAALATSDLFFLAVYSLCLLCALLAMKSNAVILWACTGVVLGLALLTRSNGPTLLVLLFLPWVRTGDRSDRVKSFCAVVLGLVAPLVIWASMARITHSPLLPTNNHGSLALTYFASGNRYDGDELNELGHRFANVFDVLSYDPLHLGITYTKDLVSMVESTFSNKGVLAFPLYLLALPGLFFLLSRWDRPFDRVFIIATILQVLLVNFQAYQTRFFLFLVPLLGAAAGLTVEAIVDASHLKWTRRITGVVLGSFLLLGLKQSFSETYQRLHADETELSEAVPTVRQWLNSDTLVVTRKGHIPFYTGSRLLVFPQVNTLDELRVILESRSREGTIYLYYGSTERNLRPQFQVLSFPEMAPGWLTPVAQSKAGNLWALYRFSPRARNYDAYVKP